MRVLDELLDLLLPTPCALCRAVGSSVCQGCSAKFSFESRLVSRGNLDGFAASSYGEVERKLLHDFKELGQTSLIQHLAKPMMPLLNELTAAQVNPLIVPVPSSRLNFKKRGFSPALLLARRVTRACSSPATVKAALRFTRIVADQSGLDSDSRQLNLAGSMAANLGVGGRNVVLFDDIVTTGATILEANRAIVSAGGIVIGFLAFAETILKTSSKT